ncbi:MAG: PIN domain-containing protein, partial [Actinobacteria bacterium]|nr:PIN domain-containing protein [Actinomycetota bacterium]
PHTAAGPDASPRLRRPCRAPGRRAVKLWYLDSSAIVKFAVEEPETAAIAAWLADLLGGADEVGVTEGGLTGFLRIVTNPRIYADPAPTEDALAFVDVVRRSRRRRWVAATDSVWTTFSGAGASDPQVRGNLVSDAWLAALALAHGCRVATADHGFARFDGLDWFDPARPRMTASTK